MSVVVKFPEAAAEGPVEAIRQALLGFNRINQGLSGLCSAIVASELAETERQAVLVSLVEAQHFLMQANAAYIRGAVAPRLS